MIMNFVRQIFNEMGEFRQFKSFDIIIAALIEFQSLKD